jgi:hypothetical protein
MLAVPEHVGAVDQTAGPLTLPAYLALVAAVTASFIGVAALLRPSLAYTIGDALGLAEEVRPAPTSFYTQRVAPVLEAHCVGCHGDRRPRDGLRLDDLKFLMRGGEEGPAVVPGNPGKSPVYERLLLPSADPRAMPPDGRAPLSSDEMEVLRLWIARGASATAGASEFRDAPAARRSIEAPHYDPATVARERKPLSSAVEAYQRTWPGILDYESRSSALVEVRAYLLRRRFGDAELGRLGDLSSSVVRLDAAGTALTDEAAGTIRKMRRLRTATLSDTQVGAAVVEALAELPQLVSVSLVGVAVEKSLIDRLRRRGVKVHDGSLGTNAVPR